MQCLIKCDKNIVYGWNLNKELTNNIKQGYQIIHGKIVAFFIMLYLSNNNDIFYLNDVGLKVKYSIWGHVIKIEKCRKIYMYININQ